VATAKITKKKFLSHPNAALLLWKACIIKLFGLGLYIPKTFWTVVGLGLNLKKSGLDLDCKMWQSAHLWYMGVVLHAHPVCGESRIQKKRLPGGCNTCSKVGHDLLKWLRVKETS